jgi:hypothetical protein
VLSLTGGIPFRVHILRHDGGQIDRIGYTVSYLDARRSFLGFFLREYYGSSFIMRSMLRKKLL